MLPLSSRLLLIFQRRFRLCKLLGTGLALGNLNVYKSAKFLPLQQLGASWPYPTSTGMRLYRGESHWKSHDRDRSNAVGPLLLAMAEPGLETLAMQVQEEQPDYSQH